MKEYIEVNDIVCVNFNGAQSTLCRSAKVLHVPAATGDSWIFEDTRSGDVHYVSEGCTVTKTKPNSEVHRGG